MRRAVVALILFLLAYTPKPAAGQDSMWRRDLGPDLYVHFLLSGDILASTNDETLLLSGETGETLWERSDLRDCGSIRSHPQYEFKCKYMDLDDLYFEVPRSVPSRLIGHEAVDGDFAVFDLETGTTLFDSQDHSFGKIRRYVRSEPADQAVLFIEGEGDAGLFSGIRLSDGEVIWQTAAPTDSDPAWLGVFDDGSVLVYAKDGGERHLTMLDLDAGEIAWDNSEHLEEDVKADNWGRPLRLTGAAWRPKTHRVRPLIHDSDSTFIAFVSKDGPMRLDRAGGLVWRNSDLAGEDPSQMTLDDGALYVLQDRNVYALDAADGRTQWRHRARFDPDFIQVHDRGVLVWAEKSIDLLDKQSGTPLWQHPVDIPEACVCAHVTTEEEVYVAGERVLAEVNLLTGRLRTLAGYEFGDGERPDRLELDGTRFIAESAQNILHYDSADDRGPSHHHFKASRPSGWSVLGAIALDVAGGRGYFTEGLRSSTNAARARVAEYSYFYFENEDGDEGHRYGFARVNRNTGDEAGTLWLNLENPRLGLDFETDTFFAEKDGAIHAFRFPD